jgi:hypothetical protein
VEKHKGDHREGQNDVKNDCGGFDQVHGNFLVSDG